MEFYVQLKITGMDINWRWNAGDRADPAKVASIFTTPMLAPIDGRLGAALSRILKQLDKRHFQRTKCLPLLRQSRRKIDDLAMRSPGGRRDG